MLSNDQHPGVFAFLVGLIVLVMVGVGLSLLVDRRFSFSSKSSHTVNAIEAGETELQGLKDWLQASSLRLADAEPLFRMVSTVKTVNERLEAFERRRIDLTAARDDLQTSIQTLGQDYSQYRTKYRGGIWAAAKGEELGILAIRGGREYRQAVIIRVTEVGLEIRHEDGLARVQAVDLDSALQERFQWNDEERRARLNAEAAAEAVVTVAPEATEPKTESPVKPKLLKRDTPSPDQIKLEALRRKVSAWKARVAQLKRERNEAISASSRGSHTSVPGSLETWQAKATRLGAALSAAQAELTAAKADLAGVAPGDPFLRLDVDGY